MICIGCNGEIKLCYKDKNQYAYNILDDNMENIFVNIIDEIKFCDFSQCNNNYYDCLCGCPLSFEGNRNKYCYNNLIKEVVYHEKIDIKTYNNNLCCLHNE